MSGISWLFCCPYGLLISFLPKHNISYAPVKIKYSLFYQKYCYLQNFIFWNIWKQLDSENRTGVFCGMNGYKRMSYSCLVVSLQHSVLGNVFQVGGFDRLGVTPADRQFNTVSQFNLLWGGIFNIFKIHHKRTVALWETGRKTLTYSLNGFVYFVRFLFICIDNDLPPDSFDICDRIAGECIAFAIGSNIQKSSLAFDSKPDCFIEGFWQISLYGILRNIIYMTDFIRVRDIIGMAGKKNNCTLRASLVDRRSEVDTI